jgi:hypothetical protein
MSTRSPYPTDLCDDEWEILEPLVPRAKPGGRPRAHQTREILNAIFYVLTGVDVLGACSRTTSPCRGRPPTITSGLGAWTVPGSTYTPLYGRGCASFWVESLPPARRSSTPRVGQDHRERRRTRLRRWQEDQR